jgi:hypothetical protein
MRSPVVAAVISLMVVCAEADTTEETVIRIFNEPTLAEGLKLIHPHNREPVVKFLRDVATGKITHIDSTRPVSYTAATILLMRLGDPEGMQLAANRYRKALGTQSIASILRDIEASRQPAMINYLGPDFLLEDGVRGTTKHHGGDLIAWRHHPQSIHSIMLTLHIIQDSDRFTSEMKQWADAMKKNMYRSRDAFKQTARIWWEENKTLFAAGEYEAVHPVPLTAFKQPGVPTPVPEPRPPAPAPERVAASASVPQIETAKLIATPPASAERKGESGPPMWVLITCATIALMIGLVVFWKHRT